MENVKNIGDIQEIVVNDSEGKIYEKPLSLENFKYYNEYGGFISNGKEYSIKLNKEDRLPTVWSNILANKEFGTLVTESGRRIYME